VPGWGATQSRVGIGGAPGDQQIVGGVVRVHVGEYGGDHCGVESNTRLELGM